MHVENATAAFEFFEVIGCYSDLKAVGSGAFGFVWYPQAGSEGFWVLNGQS